MRLWRISTYTDLSGLGGLRASGRWHTRGRRVVYLADHPASALLEMIVRLEPDVVPDTYTLLCVSLPDILETSEIELDELPADWRERPALTRQLGDQWLDASETALISVPSAIVPSAHHYLMNPAHAASAYARVLDVIRAPFDPRLMRRA